MTDLDRLDVGEEKPDFLDGARAEYNECKEVRRLLGYLWTATGYRTGNLRVCDLFSDTDPIRDDIDRLAIFPVPSDD